MELKTIYPMPKKVFCRQIESLEKTKSGILLTPTAKEKPNIAEVINIGQEIKTVKPKDTIIFKLYGAIEVKLNDEHFLLLDEEDILGIIMETE